MNFRDVFYIYGTHDDLYQTLHIFQNCIKYGTHHLKDGLKDTQPCITYCGPHEKAYTRTTYIKHVCNV